MLAFTSKSLKIKIVKGQCLELIALSSKLGWLLTVNLSSSTTGIGLESIFIHCSNSCEHEAKLLELVRDFGRSEEISVDKKSYSPDEACEEFYQKTTRQDETGRYILSLPWKNRENLSSAHLGNSHFATLGALNRLEATSLRTKS